MDNQTLSESFNLLTWLFILVLVMLLLAFSGDMQGGFYVLLRWVLAGVFVFAAVVFNQLEMKKQTVTFSILAVVYNPVIPLYLGLEIWTIVNAITFFYVLIYTFVAAKTRKILAENSSKGAL